MTFIHGATTSLWLALILFLCFSSTLAWTLSRPKEWRCSTRSQIQQQWPGVDGTLNRRETLHRSLTTLTSALLTVIVGKSCPQAAQAYTPDPDPLRESLYLLCRVQEATLLQERYIQRKRPPISKMKLTLRLVERSYRIQDQVNYVSRYIPPDHIVAATEAGNQAAESLQDAISFVNAFKNNEKEQQQEPMTSEQRAFLLEALADTRQKIFEFVDYLPDSAPLLSAWARVEQENKLNRDEFDPDLADEATGVYTPIDLPWKTI
jgi:hypothetical protein